MIKIYSTNNDPLADLNAQGRGYRWDIYVLKSGNFFNVNFYESGVIIQEFEEDLKARGFYDIKPNIILLEEVTMNNIRYTIEKLDEQDFFENLKSIEKKVLDTITLFER